MQQPYCKTCHKAGKSFKEYTSHWTRDKPGPHGKIICPIILNTLCSYCNTYGHWRKYCPELNKNIIIRDNKPPPTNTNTWANVLKNNNIKPNNIIQKQFKTISSNGETQPNSPDYTPPSSPIIRPDSPDYPPIYVDYFAQPKN